VGVFSYWCVLPLSGFPPADRAVRDYLSTSGSKHIVFNRCSAFLRLYLRIRTNFFTMSDHPITSRLRKFRTKMTVAQHMKGHNQHRRDFYKHVIEKASLLKRRVRNIPVHYAQLRCSLVQSPLLQQSRGIPLIKDAVKCFRKVSSLEDSPKEIERRRQIAAMSLVLFSRLPRRIQ
jgi:hypothetical protein